MGTGRELLLRPVVIHHGRRCSGQKGRIERTAEGLHLAMERREVQGRGGTQEAEGEASQEEGDRAEQEKKVAEQKRAEELALKREEEEKKEIEAQEKKKAMEEAERKRQEMLAAQKEKGGKKSQAPAMDARKEMSKSKEQVEEEMKISLSIRIKPLPLESMDSDELRSKANAIWNTIVELETDKYDMNRDELTKTTSSRNSTRDESS